MFKVMLTAIFAFSFPILAARVGMANVGQPIAGVLARLRLAFEGLPGSVWLATFLLLAAIVAALLPTKISWPGRPGHPRRPAK
jgi:hypothetical protein